MTQNIGKTNKILKLQTWFSFHVDNCNPEEVILQGYCEHGYQIEIQIANWILLWIVRYIANKNMTILSKNKWDNKIIRDQFLYICQSKKFHTASKSQTIICVTLEVVIVFMIWHLWLIQCKNLYTDSVDKLNPNYKLICHT